MEAVTRLDTDLLLFIQENFRFAPLDRGMEIYTAMNNNGILAMLLVLGFLLIRKTRYAGAVMGLSLLVQAVITNVLLKNIVGRMRPYEATDRILLMIAPATDYSFPSGHTGSMFAIAAAAAFLLPKKYGRTLLLLSFIMAYSRLHVGIHYPTDVLAGILIGCFTGVLAVKGAEKIGVLQKLKKSDDPSRS